MKRHGFTLIELLAVIVILAIVAIIATPLIMNIIDEARKNAFKDSAYGIVKAAELNYIKDVFNNNVNDVSYTYINKEEYSSPKNKELVYKGERPNTGIVSVNTEGKIAVYLHNGKHCATKDYNEDEIIVSELNEAKCTPYNQTQNVNRPVLLEEMRPIKWNSETKDWDYTDIDDPDWYDYTISGGKKWANAQTVDGSFWVWLPRYAYQIADGYHLSETGQINIKFLIGDSNTAIDGTEIETQPKYLDNRQLNFFVHPAFTFGDDEVYGIWVAKFRVSGDLDNIESKPNVKFLSSVTIGEFFTASRDMEKNNRYGWGIDGHGFDTHLMKNTEFGAIAYLTHSDYGNDHEVWLNNSSNYYTGCSGGDIDADSYEGSEENECQYDYDDEVYGGGASSTGNVYGVYDLSTLYPEYVAAYYSNGSASSIQQGASIINAGPNYYNVYNSTGSGASQAVLLTNYENAEFIKGDAVYETSSCISDYCGWNGDYVYIPGGANPWFHRTGLSGHGLFYFGWSSGHAWDTNGFRVVIIPGKNL